MSELKCTVKGYSSVNEANQCRSQMEAHTGRPYVELSPLTMTFR